MNSETIYEHYQAYCHSIGTQPATREAYERDLTECGNGPMAFSRYGLNDLLMANGRRLRKAFVLRIGDALGVEDQHLMLTALGLVDANGVTAKGKTVSKVRIINSVEYRLWNVFRIGRMLGTLKTVPVREPETQPRPEPLVTEFLMTNRELDTMTLPEPDSLEAMAA